MKMYFDKPEEYPILKSFYKHRLKLIYTTLKFYNLITKINSTYEKDSSFPIRNFMAEGSSFLTMKR